VKAATFATQKWAWYAELDPDLVVVRLSIGRYGDERVLQRDDADLVDAALADSDRLRPSPAGHDLSTRA
jgi:oxygen-dependent protoporphyrinogen oxidase